MVRYGTYFNGPDHPITLLLAEDRRPLVDCDLFVGVDPNYQVAAHGLGLPKTSDLLYYLITESITGIP